ncbi:MAG: hypothetical protein ACOVO1_02880 [Chitinophagaceae bacterium]
MKKVIILSFVFVNTMFAALCQEDKFTAAMTATLEHMKAAKTAEETAEVAAKFERIADAEKTQWLPYYYAALIKAQLAFGATDKDKAADEATILLDKASAISKDNSEIYCVRATICYAHMMVDPMSRWMQYGGEATKNLAASKKADATNPRPYILEANSLKNTPEQFGGGCATAKPAAEKAAKMLIEFKPASSLHPIWGKEIIDQILEGCK